jgi:hypothetical protein
MAKIQRPKGPRLDSAPKVHKSSILYKEFNKEKKHMKILIWDPCRFVLLGKEIFLGSMENPRNKPKVLPWIS